MRAPRGFTLLELVISASLMLGVSAVAMGVLLSVQRVQRDAQVKVVVVRDAQFALDSIARDLQFVGSGVPRGRELYTSAALRLRPPIRIGREDYLAFIGDLPFPNADVNGSMLLQNVGNPNPPVNDPASRMRQILVTSELALCAPPLTAPGTTAYRCRTGERRLVDVGSTADCDAGNALAAPTCPWSLGKWQGAGGFGLPFPVKVVIATPGGSWVRREITGGGDAYGDAMAIDLNPSYPSNSNPPGPGQDGDLIAADFVQRRAGSSLISHLDRVFFSLEKLDGSACAGTSDCVLRRRQCWGWPNDLFPNEDAFPRVDAPPIRSGDDIEGCAPGDEGTAWETILHGVSRFHFAYFATSETPALSVPLNANESADVMFIEILIELERSLPAAVAGGPPLTIKQTFTRRVFMEDAGGAFIDESAPRVSATIGVNVANDVSAAQGGCTTELTCGRH